MVQKCMKRVKRSEHSDAPSSTSTTSKSSQPASPAKYSKSSKSEPAIGRCWDWIITRGNCHYAKDRASFARYRNISHLVSFCPDEPPFTPIAGVGTVILQVKMSLEEGKPTRTLTLHDVLHAPSAPCNGFSPLRYHLSNGGLVAGGRMSGVDIRGQPLWCSQPFCGLKKLAISGNPKGWSYILGDGTTYCVDMELHERELEKIVAVPKGAHRVSRSNRAIESLHPVVESKASLK